MRVAFRLLLCFFLAAPALGQNADAVSLLQGTLFDSNEPLSLKLSYSIKRLKKETNDSTYMPTKVSYEDEDGNWKELNASIRARGKFRLANCFYSPVKLKLKKKAAQSSLFQSNRTLKVVFPCHRVNRKNDMVLKEFLAYKLFEVISPYHLKTRLCKIEFQEERPNKSRVHHLMAILVEDIDDLAERHNGRKIKQFVPAMKQDHLCAIRNDFFQYMMGNTDFSLTYKHNQKLLYADGKLIPIPYDFDMSGFVDSNYAVVSQVQNETLPINNVRQRLYRGHHRDNRLCKEIRKEFLEKQEEFIAVLNSYADYFESEAEFSKAMKYLQSFFKTLSNEKLFTREILTAGRNR
ncbi:MAG: hypothetical protein KJO23_00210 [Bacteroidia bacterium]|nr:hypothetical protein [Bacteroidia bacterium]NNM23996.1 hypothetical protein [Flavobacteriaceae bacterium]